MPQDGENVRATCALLRTLLAEDLNYRRRWCVHAGRAPGLLNQSAVAKTIQLYLWDAGEFSDTDALARRMKDRISRVFNEKLITSQTLEWFIGAFEMSKADSDRLWAIFSGCFGSPSEIAHTLRDRREMIRRQRHRTANLVERYRVDRCGTLSTRRTTHTIRAVEDGVDVYVFNHESFARRVEVIYGGSIGRQHRYGGGLYCVEIHLERPLNKNDTIGLDYRTFFGPARTQVTEVRRAAFARVENLDLAVRFEGAAPRLAWWCVWDDHLEGAPVEERPVELERGSIRQFIRSAEETVVGFRWTW